MKAVGLAFALFLSPLLFSQSPDTTAILYGNTITSADLKKHLSVLASDAYEGRETGKEGQKKSAKYISEQLQSFGIPPMKDGIYYQTFALYPSISLKTVIKAGKKEFNMLEDFYYFRGTSYEAISRTELVFAGYGISDKNYDDYKGTDVKDKIVLILDNEPYNKDSLSLVTKEKKPSKWTKDHQVKTELAKQKGARAVFYVVNDFEKWKNKSKHFFESPSLSLDKPDGSDMPVIFISEGMASQLLAASKKLKDVQSAAQLIAAEGPRSEAIKQNVLIDFRQSTDPILSENVIGYIEGSDLKEQVVLITAHYDHLGAHDGKVYNGADDDGSGTVAIIEIAEAFMKAKKNGHGPRRSIMVMGFSGEEKGLLGSKYYVANPVFPLANTVCDLNIDMIGRVDDKHKDSADYIYIIGSDMLSKRLHEVNEKANAWYTKLKLDYAYNDIKDKNRFYYRSDHYNFAKNGIPVIFYFNGTHADYHKESDEIEKINFELMEKRARLVFYTAWVIANMDERIAADKKQENKD
ncbi:MAG: M28 family peptidase [Bacteroidota bacterium]